MRDETALLQAIAEGDDTARLALADLWEEKGDPRAPWAREQRLFAWMLPDGRDPLPGLLAAAEENEGRLYEAVEALPLLGAHAVPALMRRVEAGEQWAGLAMAGMRPEDVGDVVPRLLRLVRNRRADGLLPAAFALRAAGPDTAPPPPAPLHFPSEQMTDEDDDDVFVEDDDHAEALARTLGAIGPAARAAVPTLARLLVAILESAETALVEIGPTGVPDLLEATERLPENGYIFAARPLSRLAEAALPQLRQALRHQSPRIRGVAGLALAPHAPEEAMPALVVGLAYRAGIDAYDDELYADAILEASAFTPPPLGELRAVLPDLTGTAAQKVAGCLERLEGPGGMMALLRERVADPNPRRRARAVHTLGVLPGVPDDAVSAVLPLLQDEDDEVRHEARLMLSGVAGAGRPHLIAPALPGLLRHDEEDTVVWAMEELARLNEGENRGLLRGMLSARKQEVRNRAVELLRGPSSSDIVPDLLRLAGGRSVASRAAALEALGETGPLTDAVRGAIRAGLADKSGQVREAALRAAALRGADAVGAAEEVRRLAAEGKTANLRRAAVAALPWCGLPPAEAAALLAGRLADRDAGVQAEAAYGLAFLAEQDGAAVVGAVPPLLGLLGAHDYEACEAAAWALSRVGGPAAPGLAALLREGADEDVRFHACQALQFMGEAAAPAAGALLGALVEEHEGLRERAAWALALSAPAGTDTASIRRLLSAEVADTVEYAITALVRLGDAEAWPEVAPLVAFERGDVAPAVVWASRRLLPPDRALPLWRGWLNSTSEEVRRAARYELWRAGEAEALPTEELLPASAVLGIREEVAAALAERALANPDDFAALLDAAGTGAHSSHGTASMALARVGRRREAEAAAALMSALDACSDEVFRRFVIAALAGLPTAALATVLPRLRELCEEGGSPLRGPALELFRRVIAEGVGGA